MREVFLERLAALRPTWVVSEASDDDGCQTVRVQVFKRPASDGARGARDLLELRDVRLPALVPVAGEFEVVHTPEEWVAAACKVLRADHRPLPPDLFPARA